MHAHAHTAVGLGTARALGNVAACPISESTTNLNSFQTQHSLPSAEGQMSFPNSAEDDLASFIDFLALLESP